MVAVDYTGSNLEHAFGANPAIDLPINKIVETATKGLPVSIIIVGVAKGLFDSMNLLDGDFMDYVTTNSNNNSSRKCLSKLEKKKVVYGDKIHKHHIPYEIQLHQELIEMIGLIQLMLGFVNLITLDVYVRVIWMELDCNMTYHLVLFFRRFFSFFLSYVSQQVVH